MKNMFKKLLIFFKFLVFLLLVIIFAIPEGFKADKRNEEKSEPIVPPEQAQPHLPHNHIPEITAERGRMVVTSINASASVVEVFDRFIKNN